MRTKYVKCYAWLLYFMMLVCAFVDFPYHQPRFPLFVCPCSLLVLLALTDELVIPFQMSNITVTYRDGRVAQLEQVYIRGSKIRFLILPDMLKNAPMLKSMKNKNQGSGAGRGKAAILKAQGMCSSCTGFNICVGPVSFRKGPCQFPGHRGGLGLQPSPHTATLQSWGPRCERLGALSCLLCLASPDHIHRAYAKSKVPP